MSQESSVSLPPSSQPTEGGVPAPTPTSKWRIWSRGVNAKGDWHCTHKFADDTQTYHYVHEDGTVYMKHRDGSATSVPTEGTYKPSGGRDSDSKIPAPTMEEIIEEYKKVKKEHTEYLDCPLKYWNGVCTTLQPRRRRRHVDVAWLFPICDCCDRYDSVSDDDYPGYDYEGDYDYWDEYGENYNEDLEEYRNSEDEEEDYSDEDRSSPSLDEQKEIIKQEDDKAIVRMTDGPHLSAATEAKVDVKQETKEGVFDGLVIGHLADPKLKKEETPADTIPGAVLVESAAAGNGAGERASTSSRVGPDVQTEGKRILRSHRSKPY